MKIQESIWFKRWPMICCCLLFIILALSITGLVLSFNEMGDTDDVSDQEKFSPLFIISCIGLGIVFLFIFIVICVSQCLSKGISGGGSGGGGSTHTHSSAIPPITHYSGGSSGTSSVGYGSVRTVSSTFDSNAYGYGIGGFKPMYVYKWGKMPSV